VNIVVVHNFYQQAGGEDQVFADEASLLESHGHVVERFTVHNDAVESMGRLRLAQKTIWNKDAAATLAQVVRRTSASVVHFHNTFPLISPAAYRAVADQGAAVVQTLHNYRLICPSATFFRDGSVCEDCLKRPVPWPAVAHSCYRDNRSASAAVAAMLTVNRARGTYRDDVDAYIALTEFSRGKFIEAGFPQDRISVKPNFVQPDPGIGTGTENFVLFVGRLTAEKGVQFLLRAWRKLDNQFTLKILGDGPLRSEVEAAASADPGIQYLGRRPLAEIYDMMGKAQALIFPSLWYEGLPRTIVESFSKGTPVVASRLGSMAELITHGVDGLLFEPGDEADLAAQMNRLFVNPTSAGSSGMRARARQTFETKYTAEQNYPALMAIYHAALGLAAGRSERTSALNDGRVSSAIAPLTAQPCGRTG
jgi:glycosyltransferase involved in cell wall biosynthesis